MISPEMVSVTDRKPRCRRVRRRSGGWGMLLVLLSGLLCAEDRVVALKAGQVYTATEKGIIEKGVILIQGDRILAVGDDVSIPPEAEVYDFPDKFLMPGIVSPDSNLGIFRRTAPVSLVFFRRAEPEGKNLAFYPVLYSYIPDHPDYQLALKAGFTTLALSPPPEGISGLGAVIRPSGETLERFLVKDRAFLKIHVYVHTPFWNMLKKSLEDGQKELDKIKKKKEEVKKDAKGKKESEKDKKMEEEEPEPSETTKVFIEIVEGKIPLLAECPGPDAVSHILELVSGFPQVKLIVRGGPDTYKVGHLLKQKNIPLILEPGIDTKESFNAPYPERTNYVLKCQGLGLQISFQAPGNVEEQVFLFDSLNSLYHLGVKKDILLKGVTAMPAQILGLESLVGSLEKGKKADVIVLRGDPLEGVPVIEKVMLGGKFLK